MSSPTYIVFDDAIEASALEFTADQFADLLRGPLLAIGVRVVRQRRDGAASQLAGFQGRGRSRNEYDNKRREVDHVVNRAISTRSRALR